MSIEAMKQALDALERSVATCFDQYSHQQAMSQPAHFINQAIKSLRQAIAEAEKQVQNEPVGWIDSKGNMICTKINESCRPLYTHPQPRKPLTDREIGSVIDDVKEKSLYASHHFGFWIEFCRAIEKAHGIKE